MTVVTHGIDKIPADPILRAVGLRGGIGPVFRSIGIGRWVESDNPGRPKVAYDSPEEEVFETRHRSAYDSMKARGDVDYYVADAFCCEVLKVHPVVVYGAAWYEFDEVPVEVEVLHRKHFTEEMESDIWQLHQEGTSARKLAEKFHTSRYVMNRIIRELRSQEGEAA